MVTGNVPANAPEPRRFRRMRLWTPFCRKAGGGAAGNRTPDLDIANVALSQLSYGPDPKEA